MYYIFNFLLYSILGYFIELIFKALLNFNLHSGILYGPYCPVYGFGITIIYLIYYKIEKKYNIKKIKKYLIFFIISFLLLNIFEAIGGYLIELCFDKVYWNYDDLPLNIGHYISIEMGLVWSIGTILLYKYIKPKTDNIYNKTNKNIINFFILIMFIDIIITIINKINA